MFLFRMATAPLRWFLKIVLFLVMAVVIYLAVTLVQVWLTSREYQPVQAQAIVVMGSAQYNGVPSPDLASRLGQALALWREGYAHLIMCTGYKQPGDHYTESQAGQMWLEARGVPATDILQAGGNDSWENLTQAASQLKAMGDTDVLLVTDPYHEDRSMAIATDVGLTPHPTPTLDSPIKGTAVVPYFLKEAVGVGVGRIIGYQYLHSLFG